MNRRNFIKGLAGLVAVAASGKTFAFLPQTERTRLMDLAISGGVIEKQTFIIEDSGPIVLDGIRNLTIRCCNFVWKVPAKSHLLEMNDCHGLMIDSCYFDGRKAV